MRGRGMGSRKGKGKGKAENALYLKEPEKKVFVSSINKALFYADVSYCVITSIYETINVLIREESFFFNRVLVLRKIVMM